MKNSTKGLKKDNGHIKNRIGKLVYKKIGELKNFQGNLKELSEDSYEKLKTSFKKHGNIAPVFIWRNNILDGHQRIKTLLEMKAEGSPIPEKLPCVEIRAGNIKEAKRFLLQFVSQHGEVTEEGLYEFLHEAKLEKELKKLQRELVIPHIDLESFERGYFTDSNEKETVEFEASKDTKSDNECPKCGHQW